MSENETAIKIPEDKKTICEICNKKFHSKVGISVHVSTIHNISYEQYIIKYYNNNQRPVCIICSKETRYVSKNISFRKYCSEHSNDARSSWSKNNGYGVKQDAGWKRGLTKENNETIKKHSEWMTGENNPMHKNNSNNRNKNDN